MPDIQGIRKCGKGLAGLGLGVLVCLTLSTTCSWLNPNDGQPDLKVSRDWQIVVIHGLILLGKMHEIIRNLLI